MKKWFLLLPLAVLVYAFCRPVTKATRALENPPNIILIVTDDLGLTDLGVYGNDFIETPRLDALAANGLLYTQAYAAAPICSPSRAAIQTGLYPARIAMTEHTRGTPPVDPCQPVIPPKSAGRLAFVYTTLGESLLEAGYHTHYVGKWHLGSFNHVPINQGYQTSLAAGGQGLPASFFPPFFNNNNYPELVATGEPYLTDALTTLALETIPDGPTDTPFFLDLNYYSPHVPIEGPPELVAKYEALAPADPDFLPRPEYAAMVERIDQQVGRLMDSLDARGLLDNTLVLFTSDHGPLTVEEVPAFAQHTPPTTAAPYREGKGYVYEGGLRVPLIAHWPAMLEPAVVETPNTNLDYLPTFAALAEAPLPDLLDGEAIPSITNGPALPIERSFYWHFPHYSPQRGQPAGMLRRGDYKLIQWYSDVDSISLYNLAEDVGETTNLADTEPDLAASLLADYESWKVEVGARPAIDNPAFNADDCN